MNRILHQLLYDFFDNMVEIPILAAATVVGGILFSGLHCLAWAFHFPTRGETLAWRVGSVMTSALPPAIVTSAVGQLGLMASME
jgi:hypothetical protein